MIRKKLENYLQLEGFFPLTSNVKEITAMVKVENNLLNILQIVDYTKELYLDTEQYEEIKQSLKSTFKDRGVSNVHILSLFLKEDMEKGQAVIKEDPFCWELDTNSLELFIGEDKQPDFYGMKGIIQSFIEDIDKVPEDLMQELSEKTEKEEKVSKKEVIAKYLKIAPYASLTIIFINMIMCFGCIWNPSFFYGKGSLGLEYIIEGEWYRLITAMFLHGSVDHFFSNMLLLFCLGMVMERKIGMIRFSILYLLTGIIGNLFSCAHEYVSNVFYISYGASGAVFGLIGVLFYLVLIKGKELRISMPSMIIMVVYCIYSSFVGENINVAAHLGGLLSGMLLMFVFYGNSFRRSK